MRTQLLKLNHAEKSRESLTGLQTTALFDTRKNLYAFVSNVKCKSGFRIFIFITPGNFIECQVEYLCAFILS